MSILVGLLLLGTLIALPVLFWLRSAASRKTLVCGQCGEQVTVELMQGTHCQSCGAPL